MMATGCAHGPGLHGGTLHGAVPTAETWPKKMHQRCERLEPLIEEAASRREVDRGLVAGIIRVESGFRPWVVSSAGAIGLMQVMPRNGENLSCGSLKEPAANIACGITVLEGFLKAYDDDLTYGLSAYNAGWRIPNKAKKAGRLPSNFSYVEKVLAARAHYLRHGCAP
jgi:soluble lytic murein transglycosylase-like protein